MDSKRLSELRYKGHITDSEYKELKLAIKTFEDKGKIQSKLIDKVIDSIAEQYSKHNTLVPYWLSIGDIRIEGAENESSN